MAKLNNWLLENEFILNAEKTKVMVLGSHQRIGSLADPILRVSVAGQPLECVQLLKYLGVTLDNHLTLKKNISSIIRQKLGIVGRLRKVLRYTGNMFSLISFTVICNTWSKRSWQALMI